MVVFKGSNGAMRSMRSMKRSASAYKYRRLATMSFEDEYISRRELRIFFGASETSDSGTSHVGSDRHTRASLRF